MDTCRQPFKYIGKYRLLIKKTVQKIIGLVIFYCYALKNKQTNKNKRKRKIKK